MTAHRTYRHTCGPFKATTQHQLGGHMNVFHWPTETRVQFKATTQHQLGGHGCGWQFWHRPIGRQLLSLTRIRHHWKKSSATCDLDATWLDTNAGRGDVAEGSSLSSEISGCRHLAGWTLPRRQSLWRMELRSCLVPFATVVCHLEQTQRATRLQVMRQATHSYWIKWR